MQKRNAGLGMMAGLLLVVSACGRDNDSKRVTDMKPKEHGMAEVEVITLGAGCFWCTEAAYNLIEGVKDVNVGYMGGDVVNPTYKAVCTGTTGHAEVAQISFDPSQVDLGTVLKVFWKVHDPTSLNKQGGDTGSQYRSAVFYHDAAQKSVVLASLKEAQKMFTRKIVTEVLPATTFYAAENYHQDYYSNNPDAGYCRAVIAPKLKKVKKLVKDL